MCNYIVNREPMLAFDRNLLQVPGHSVMCGQEKLYLGILFKIDNINEDREVNEIN